ncbi:MAG: hypothetical protein OEV92_02990 [Nitrospinota bacterium]|nr:hypothetical protein [Nitrospinota bacterium]
MFDAFKDIAKIGMGAIWLSKENLKKLSDDLAEISKASKEEGERLFEEFEKNRDEYKQKLEKTVEDGVKKALDEAGLVRKSEMDEMKKRMEDLEARLAAKEAKFQAPETD